MYLLRALALISALAATASFAQQPQKNYKDNAEYEIFSEASKDFAGNNFTKALTGLDTWKQKYPVSDYSPDREVLYIRAYMGSKQYNKAVDQAGELLSKGLDQVFPNPKEGPGQMLQILYNATVAVPFMTNPTDAELAAGGKGRPPAHVFRPPPRRPQRC